MGEVGGVGVEGVGNVRGGKGWDGRCEGEEGGVEEVRSGRGEGDKLHYWQIRFHLCPSRQQFSSHYPKVHKGLLMASYHF